MSMRLGRILAVAVMLQPLARDAAAAPDRIASVTVAGSLLDDRQAVLRAAGLTPGAAWSEAVLRRATMRLDRLGYRAHFEGTPGPDGISLALTLTPFRVVRRIYVEGTSPIFEFSDPVFEADIMRQIRMRSGDRLPEGEALHALLTEQAVRIQEYLGRQGFYDAEVEVRERSTEWPERIDLVYVLRKGKRYHVGDLDVRGNRAIPYADFREELDPTWFGWMGLRLIRRPFTVERLSRGVDEILSRYHDLGYIAARVRHGFDPATSLDRENHEVRLSVIVRERRQVELVFEVNGEVKKKPGSLLEVVTLFESGSYDDIELEASARELEHDFQRDGYFQARVSYERTKTGRDSERVVFRVARGPKFKVRGIDFAGGDSYSDDELADVIETRRYSAWSWTPFVSGGYVTTIQLRQDEERLVGFYRSRGFPEARVRGEAAPDWRALGRTGALAAAYGTGYSRDGDMLVRFYIHEGPRVLVRKVDFDGPFRSLLLGAMPELKLKPGKPFDPLLVAKDAETLLRLLSEAGYLYAEVVPEVERPSPAVATIRYRVRWRAPARFGEVFIRGNFHTHRSVIEDELAFAPGDPFDISRLAKTEDNLRRLGVFNIVRVQLMGSEDREETLHVLVNVEERYDDAGAVELGVGYSTDNPIFGAAGYRHRNLWGRAHSLQLKGEYGPEIGEIRGTYMVPFTHAWQLEQVLYGRGETTERLGNIRVFGGSTTLRWKEPVPHLTTYLRYSLRQVRLDKQLVRLSGPFDEDAKVPLTPRTGEIGPGAVYDWRDNPFSPTCGWQIGGSASYAHQYLLGTSQFATFHGNAQLLVPGSKDAARTFRGCEGLPLKGPFRAPFTLAQGFRYDHGLPLGGDVILPEIDRFFAGGDTTVRGFEEDGLKTSLIEYELVPGGGITAFRSAPQGGNIRILHNLELWIPIPTEYVTLFGLPLMTAAFLDTGLIANSLEKLELTDFRHGAGGALRVLMPFGFLSFEYAFPLDPGRTDDPTGRLHINFGLAFQF